MNASVVYVSSPGDAVSGVPDTWLLREVRIGVLPYALTQQVEITRPADVTDVLPFFLSTTARFPVPSPTTEFSGEPPIRWLRRTPHTIASGHRVFFSKTELLLDVGGGGTVAQRYSNDGAQTWSTPREQAIGTSSTTQRLLWPQNGSGRDRVWEWYGSSAAPARLLDVFVTVVDGSS